MTHFCAQSILSDQLFFLVQEEPTASPQIDDSRDPKEISVIITPNRLDAEEGAEVVFECRVLSGNSRIVWEKLDGSLPEGVSPYEPRLVIKNFRREDAGRYTCSAIDNAPPETASAELLVARGKYSLRDKSNRILPAKKTQNQLSDWSICTICNLPSNFSAW